MHVTKVCFVCANSLTPNSGTGQYCILCNVPGCSSCSSNNYCYQCINSSYVPNTMGNACVECGIANCQFCSQQALCQICQPGFTLMLTYNGVATVNKCTNFS